MVHKWNKIITLWFNVLIFLNDVATVAQRNIDSVILLHYIPHNNLLPSRFIHTATTLLKAPFKRWFFSQWWLLSRCVLLLMFPQLIYSFIDCDRLEWAKGQWWLTRCVLSKVQLEKTTLAALLCSSKQKQTVHVLSCEVHNQSSMVQ